MAIKFAPQPTDPIRMSIYTDAQWDYLPFGFFLLLLVLNITLTAIFTFETIIKLIGLGRNRREGPHRTPPSLSDAPPPSSPMGPRSH